MVTRKLPISFRFTFSVFFFLLRSDKTCNFHRLQPVMRERGSKCSSVKEKQVMGRTDMPQTASQLPAALALEMAGHLQAKTWILRLRYCKSWRQLNSPLTPQPLAPVSYLLNVFPGPPSTRRKRKQIEAYDRVYRGRLFFFLSYWVFLGSQCSTKTLLVSFFLF